MNGVLEQILDELRALRAEVAELRAQPRGLVSIAAFAASKGVTPATVRGWIKAGRLTCDKSGRAWRVDADAEVAAAAQDDRAERVLRIVGGRP